jgi:hypothetical protein
MDPGCSVCAHLFKNIKEAGFENKYNLTYIAYPIADVNNPGHYKFPNSFTIIQYLEAIKRHPLEGATTPVDWQILERIYTGQDEQGIDYQIKINNLLSQDDTKFLLKYWLFDFGYNLEQITLIEADASSEAVQQIIGDNENIVTNRIKTVKIPSIIFDGRRHDGLVDVNGLK